MKFVIYEDMELVAKSQIIQVNAYQKIESLAQQITSYLVEEYDINLTKLEQKELIEIQRIIIESGIKSNKVSECVAELEGWIYGICTEFISKQLNSQKLSKARIKTLNSLNKKLNGWLIEREEEREFFTGLLEQAGMGELSISLPEEWFNFDEARE